MKFKIPKEIPKTTNQIDDITWILFRAATFQTAYRHIAMLKTSTYAASEVYFFWFNSLSGHQSGKLKL